MWVFCCCRYCSFVCFIKRPWALSLCTHYSSFLEWLPPPPTYNLPVCLPQSPQVITPLIPTLCQTQVVSGKHSQITSIQWSALSFSNVICKTQYLYQSYISVWSWNFLFVQWTVCPWPGDNGIMSLVSSMVPITKVLVLSNYFFMGKYFVPNNNNFVV